MNSIPDSVLDDIETFERQVAEFTALVHQGMECWEKAGRILCSLVAANPNAIALILADNPHLTEEILRTFIRIGRREIFPKLIIDPSLGAKALATLPYPQQEIFYAKPVPVVSRDYNGFVVKNEIRVQDLTARQIDQVFRDGRLLTVEEQLRALPAPRQKAAPAKRATASSPRYSEPKELREARAEEPEAPVFAQPPERESLSEPVPVGKRLAALHFLEKAQANLTRAREELMQVPGWTDGGPADHLITSALTPMTRLRHALAAAGRDG